MICKYICCPKSTFTLCPQVWVLTMWDCLSFIFIKFLFSLWVIRFWHYSWKAAMMQVSCSLQIKQRLWPTPLSLLAAPAVWNWTQSIPSCIMLSLSSPYPLFRSFIFWHTVHSMRSWPGSVCQGDILFWKQMTSLKVVCSNQALAQRPKRDGFAILDTQKTWTSP